VCFGDTVGNVCKDCKHFVLGFKFDVNTNTQAFKEAISMQFQELWNHAMKSKGHFSNFLFKKLK